MANTYLLLNIWKTFSKFSVMGKKYKILLCKSFSIKGSFSL